MPGKVNGQACENVLGVMFGAPAGAGPDACGADILANSRGDEL